MLDRSSYWNCRLIEKVSKYTLGDGEEMSETYYEIHEVYYQDDIIVAWSEEPMQIYFQAGIDVREEIKHIKHAAKQTILKIVHEEGYGDKLVDTGKYIKHVKYE